MNPEKTPRCTDIEIVILCSFFRKHEQFLRHSMDLKPEYFYNSVNEKIFRFMQEENISNYFILGDKFPDDRIYIYDIETKADACDLKPLIEILKDRYNRRKMIEACEKISTECEENYEIDAKEISETGISEISLEVETSSKPELIKEIAPRLFDNLEIIMKGEGIKTGLKDIDDTMGAIQGGEYIMLAGRPSMGKTALALCVARNLTRQKLIPLIFSLETTKEIVCGRIIFGDSNTSYDKILRGDMAELKQAKLTNDVMNMPIYVDGTPAITIGHFESVCENYVKNHGVNFILLDHIGLMKNKNGRSRHEELSELSKGIKSTLARFNVPGIILCQLSRKVEERKPPVPMLSDLRESGSLEEDADKVLFIYRDEYYNRNSEKKGIAEIIIAKNKNGRTGYCEVQFDKSTMNFRNLETHHEVVDSWVK